MSTRQKKISFEINKKREICFSHFTQQKQIARCTLICVQMLFLMKSNESCSTKRNTFAAAKIHFSFSYESQKNWKNKLKNCIFTKRKQYCYRWKEKHFFFCLTKLLFLTTFIPQTRFFFFFALKLFAMILRALHQTTQFAHMS